MEAPWTMRYLIYLALVISAFANAGEIHKWVDENGNVHYGDAPPVAAKTESVWLQSAPSNPGKALPRLSPQKQSTESGDSSETTASANNDVPKDQAAIACQQAQDDLKVINRSNRIKLRSADGTTRYLSTAEITERKDLAQADIDQFCN